MRSYILHRSTPFAYTNMTALGTKRGTGSAQPRPPVTLPTSTPKISTSSPRPSSITISQRKARVPAMTNALLALYEARGGKPWSAIVLILITRDGLRRIRFGRSTRVRCSRKRALRLIFLVIVASGDSVNGEQVGSNGTSTSVVDEESEVYVQLSRDGCEIHGRWFEVSTIPRIIETSHAGHGTCICDENPG
ncbi:hypothetical protein DL764_004496 [Monosporascus ibericus]|uniref:Uncharacterized protein n=1 Tax=Monosporascus ibericus TaxID=155417 RepID=A0A4Q4TFQ8_9PEZI|nr:hypothetical protein DL764_004496 [Monosporascus ibericus]